VDSNFRFRVRCKRGLRRKSPASAACRRPPVAVRLFTFGNAMQFVLTACQGDKFGQYGTALSKKPDNRHCGKSRCRVVCPHPGLSAVPNLSSRPYRGNDPASGHKYRSIRTSYRRSPRRKSPYSRSLDDSIAPQCALNSPGVGGTAKAGSRVHISRSTRSVSAEKVRRCHTEAVMRDSFASQNGASYLTVIPYHLRAAAGVFPIQRGGSIMRLLRCSLHCVGGGRTYRDPRVLHFGCQVGS
jgi:hypothetical protein